MHEHPLIACDHAWSDQLPVIFSTCSDEGLLIRNITKEVPFILNNLADRFQDMVPLDLGGDNRESEICKKNGETFKMVYFGLTEPMKQNISAFEGVIYSFFIQQIQLIQK